jgi:transposase
MDTVPGVNGRIAKIIVAEVGVDMQRFPSGGHRASWVGICPGNHQSAGKQVTGKTRTYAHRGNGLHTDVARSALT